MCGLTPDPEEHPCITNDTPQLRESVCRWTYGRLAQTSAMLEPCSPLQERDDELHGVLNDLNAVTSDASTDGAFGDKARD